VKNESKVEKTTYGGPGVLRPAAVQIMSKKDTTQNRGVVANYAAVWRRNSLCWGPSSSQSFLEVRGPAWSNLGKEDQLVRQEMQRLEVNKACMVDVAGSVRRVFDNWGRCDYNAAALPQRRRLCEWFHGGRTWHVQLCVCSRLHWADVSTRSLSSSSFYSTLASLSLSAVY